MNIYKIYMPRDLVDRYLKIVLFKLLKKSKRHKTEDNRSKFQSDCCMGLVAALSCFE